VNLPVGVSFCPQRILKSMQVQVLFFGMLKEAAGRDSELLSLTEGATAASVAEHYAAALPVPAEFWPSLAVAVNQQYSSRNRVLQDGDEVALLPPVSGGSQMSKSRSKIALIREPIAAEDLLRDFSSGPDGAIVTFAGIVRDNSRGRRTLFLDYEAYEDMALAQMQQLARQAFAEHGVRDVLMIHRLGRLKVGETSVFIAVASAHRAEAFDASRWLIDTLKRTVPIWKKEHFEDGAVWADGEPFPQAVTR
jgi:molybdopterin synthase catalytic subunit